MAAAATAELLKAVDPEWGQPPSLIEKDHHSPVVFLSHYQKTAQLQVAVLREALMGRGYSCFFDQDCNILNGDVMKQGVSESDLYVLFLSEGVLTRPMVRLEAQAALDNKKDVALVLEENLFHGGTSLEAIKREAMDSIAARAKTHPDEKRLHGTGLDDLFKKGGDLIIFKRGPELYAETLPALEEKIRVANGKRAGSPLTLKCLLRRPNLHTDVSSPTGCSAANGHACGVPACKLLHRELSHVLLVGAEEARDQALLFEVAARERVAHPKDRSSIVSESLSEGGSSPVVMLLGGGGGAAETPRPTCESIVKVKTLVGGDVPTAEEVKRDVSIAEAVKLAAAAAAAATALATASRAVTEAQRLVKKSGNSPGNFGFATQLISLEGDEAAWVASANAEAKKLAAAAGQEAGVKEREEEGTRAAQAARLLVVILTKNVFKSPYVRGALRSALARTAPVQLIYEQKEDFGGEPLFDNFFTSVPAELKNHNVFNVNAVRLDRAFVIREDAIAKFLWALGAYGVDIKKSEKAVKGACSKIVEALLDESRAEQAPLAENYLLTLAAIATESPSSRDNLMDAGGVKAICGAMHRHADVKSVVIAGCNALGELATVEGSLYKALKDANVARSYLTLFGSQVGFTGALMYAGYSYATSSGGSKAGAEAKEKSVAALKESAGGVLKAIVGVTQTSADAFSNILTTGSVRRQKVVGFEEEGEDSGLASMVAALENFPEDEEVVLAALRSLGSCCEGTDMGSLGCKARVAKAAMKPFIDSSSGPLFPKVAATGAWLLGSMLGGPSEKAAAEFLGRGGEEGERMAFLKRRREFVGWRAEESCAPLKALAVGLGDQAKATALGSKRMREALFKSSIHSTIAGVRKRDGLSQETLAELAKAELLIEAEKDGAMGAVAATASAFFGSILGGK